MPVQLARDIMKEMKLMREIRHTNVNNFIGAMVDQDNIKLVTEFCSKGALFDLLNNPDVKLDLMFVASLISDLGAKYLCFFLLFNFWMIKFTIMSKQARKGFWPPCAI